MTERLSADEKTGKANGKEIGFDGFDVLKPAILRVFHKKPKACFCAKRNFGGGEETGRQSAASLSSKKCEKAINNFIKR